MAMDLLRRQRRSQVRRADCALAPTRRRADVPEAQWATRLSWVQEAAKRSKGHSRRQISLIPRTVTMNRQRQGIQADRRRSRAQRGPCARRGRHRQSGAGSAASTGRDGGSGGGSTHGGRTVFRIAGSTSQFAYPQNHATNLNVCTRRAALRAVAGNHASSRPAPSGERADRARTPRKPASLALVPMGWQQV